jgi:hypothetical protein
MGRTSTWSREIPLAAGGFNDATTAIHDEGLYSVVDVSVNSTTVYNGPALLFGVYVNTVLSAHTCPITDAATTVVTLPVSAAAGTVYRFPGIRFETSLIVDPNDAGTGNITVIYRPI